VRWITRVIASVTLAVAACAPPRPPGPSVPPVSVTPAQSLAASPAARVVPVTRPSVGPAAVAEPEVKIVEPPFRPPQQWAYAPAELGVTVGIAVTWTNTGAVAHAVTADDGQNFDSGSVDPKATFTLTPTAPGTFAYHCSFHPWMKATLVVTR